MYIRSLLFLLILSITGISFASAQAPAPTRTGFALSAFALGAGAQYQVKINDRWAVSLGLTLGPIEGPTVAEGNEDAKEWGMAHLAVGVALSDRLLLHVAPVGITGIIGNDWGAVYPGARAGLQWVGDRFGVGTDFILTRIAGPYDTGEYRLTWMPLRVFLFF